MSGIPNKQRVKALCEAHGLTYEAFVSESRKYAVSHKRYHVFKDLHDAGFSYPAIAAAWGPHRHHTSVMHGVNKIEKSLGAASAAWRDKAAVLASVARLSSVGKIPSVSNVSRESGMPYSKVTTAVRSMAYEGLVSTKRVEYTLIIPKQHSEAAE